MNPVKIVSALKATDWILHRWAASVGDGLYDAPWDDVPVSKVPLLNDQTAIVVDQLIMRSDERTKRLIGYWYRTSLPKTVIARRLGVGRDTIYARWNASLWYLRERFIASPLSDLRLIATTDVEDGPIQATTAQPPTYAPTHQPAPTTCQSTLAIQSDVGHTQISNTRSCARKERKQRFA
jgi:hypothetical protein